MFLPDDVFRGLYDYQEEGVAWLIPRRRAFLWDEPRLGKSPQLIRAADALGLRRILITCDAIARYNWARLFKQWGLIERRVHVLEGMKDEIPDDAEVVICVHNLLTTYSARLSAIPFELAGVDEAHRYMTPTAQRTRALYSADGALARCERIWELTGTPVRSHYGQLWCHCWALFRRDMIAEGIPAEEEAFLDRYCTWRHTPFGKKVTGTQNWEELERFLAPRMLRRLAGDRLPPLTVETYALPGETTLMDLAAFDTGEPLADMAARWRENGADDERVQAQLSLILANAAQNATFRRLSGLAKVAGAAELISGELDDGLTKILVFCYHRQVINELAAKLEKYGVVTISGDVSPKRKEEAQQRFNNDPDCRVLIGQIDSCSTSIDLPAADEAVFVESAWVPADNAQAIKRMQLVSKKRPVRARFLSLAGTIDEAITAVIRRRTMDIAGLMNRQENPR
jgi:SWI/SNF-related matrix-associated actin-dependent regulator 1 of chromatin subfamily A